ncbi:MAG: ABC transporter ATP-binding protein [Candidatus Alcyoniella australis]|nr:ABC transporter ATP-binding protein [Candidatus Alcyoniella australis]
MIRIENLSKSYGPFEAVKGLNLEVRPGEILGFLGPNGAGKTTTMRMLTTFLPPGSGTAKVAGHDIVSEPEKVRRVVGYLPEHPLLYDDMKVHEYLRFVAAIHRVPGRRRSAAIERVVELAGLGEVIGQLIRTLSKGFRQRVGLAQALVSDPPVLILDEPTIGLDPGQMHTIRELIKSLAVSHTVIFSSHILPEVVAVASRVAIIHHGALVACDAVESLAKRFDTGDQRLLLELSRPVPEAGKILGALPSVEQIEEQGNGRYVLTAPSSEPMGPDVSLAVLQHGWGIAQMRQMRPTLEEIFIKLTAE